MIFFHWYVLLKFNISHRVTIQTVQISLEYTFLTVNNPTSIILDLPILYLDRCILSTYPPFSNSHF